MKRERERERENEGMTFKRAVSTNEAEAKQREHCFVCN
jgi:hypothetical protein